MKRNRFAMRAVSSVGQKHVPVSAIKNGFRKTTINFYNEETEELDEETEEIAEEED